MTMTLTSPSPISADSLPSRIWWSLLNAFVLARRGVARIVREPSQLLDVTVQPVIFVLLFVYVFGSAITLPSGGNYHEYLIGGMFGMGCGLLRTVEMIRFDCDAHSIRRAGCLCIWTAVALSLVELLCFLAMRGTS